MCASLAISDLPTFPLNDLVELASLLTHSNPNLIEYRELVGRSRSSQCDTGGKASSTLRQMLEWEFACDSDNPVDLFAQTIQSRVSGHPIIDLGSGLAFPELARACEFAGATCFVAVDLAIDSINSDRASRVFTSTTMGMVAVRSDMLLFLARMQSESCSICLGGIDQVIIKPAAYHEALALEISRVTRKGGIVYSGNSTAAVHLNRDASFVELKREWSVGDRVFFEKIGNES